MLASGAAAPQPGPTGDPAPTSSWRTRTETLWRCWLPGDSLYLRATWRPASGTTLCDGFVGGASTDSTNSARKYLYYWVEGAHAGTLIREDVSGEEFGICIYWLSAAATAWRSGRVLTISSLGRGCEPAGDCALKRYVWISSAGAHATSEWTGLDWNPADSSVIDSEVDDGCLTYSMTTRPELKDSVIVFAPVFSSEVREGDVLERSVADDVPDRCRRWGPAREPMLVDWFRAPRGGPAQQRLVRAQDRLEISSVAVRAERQADGTLRPAIFRVGVVLNGERGFMPRAALKNLGFQFP